jgi:hypothetical protein
MATIPSRLREFLEKHAKHPERLAEALELIQPFFRPTEPPSYGLSPPDDVDQRKAAASLSLAIGQPVNRAIFISAAHIISIDGQLRPDAANLTLSAGLRQRLGDRLWHCLGNKLWEACGRRLWDSFPEHFGQQLVRQIQDSLGANQLDSLLYGLRDVVGDCFTDGLFYYLGAAAMGDRELERRFSPLIRLLPRVVPLGERSGQPDTWFFLTA